MKAIARILTLGLLGCAALAQAAVLSGRATAQGSDEGIAQVQVIVRPAGDVPDPIGFGVTDAQGHYSIDGLGDGPNVLVAVRDGFEPHEALLILEPNGLNVHDFALTPIGGGGDGAWLHGWVFDDLSMEPVEGAQVRLNTNPMEDPRFAVTDGAGQFEIGGLAAGPASLRVQAEGWFVQERQLELVPGANGIEVGLVAEDAAEAATLAGWLLEPDGAPVAGVLVHGFQPPFRELTAVTGDEGGFGFDGLTAGELWLHVQQAGYQPLEATVMLDPGANEIALTLEPWDDPNGLALVEAFVFAAPDGPPIEGAQVLLSNQPNGDGQLLVSDAEGRVLSDSLFAGPAHVSVQAEGYLPFESPLFLAPGLNTFHWNLEPLIDEGLPATLAGTVFGGGPAGEPVAGAFLHVMPRDGEPAETFTDEDGHYAFENLTSGMGFVMVEAEGFEPFGTPLPLQPGANTRDFVLTPLVNDQPATLAVRLVDGRDGTPVGGAQLLLESHGLVLERQSGPQGWAEWQDVPGGWAALHVNHPDFHPTGEDLLVQGPVTTVVLPLTRLGDVPPGMTLHGVVLDWLTREPLPGAQVLVRPDSGEADSLSLTVGDDGFFAVDLPAVDAGGWIVRATLDGYLGASQWVPAMPPQGDFWVELLLLDDDANVDWGHLAGHVSTEGGTPVAGAELEAIPLDPMGGFSQFGQTGPTGGFQMPVMPGEYLLACRLWLGDGQPLTMFYPGTFEFGEAEPLVVTPGETLDGLDFVLPRMDGETMTVAVDGLVADEDGQPLAGATVRFWTAAEELADAATQTDGDGRFEATIVLDRLPIVPFSLSAERDGYSMEFFSDSPSFTTATQFLMSGSGTIHNADFSLAVESAGLALSGSVDAPDGSEASVLVAAFSPDGEFMRTVSADESGAFSFDGLENGELVLLYYAPGCLPVFSGGVHDLDEADHVWPDQAGALSASLQASPATAGPVTIGGHVVGVDRQPVGGALVMVETPSSGDLRFATTGSGGAYSLPGLATGVDVVLTVSAPGYESDVQSIATQSGMQQTMVIESELVPLTETSVGDAGERPARLELLPAAPNPFNPSTVLAFRLPQAGRATLTVHNLLGETVRRVELGALGAGEHRLVFDGSDLASGVYLARLEAGGEARTERLLLLK